MSMLGMFVESLSGHDRGTVYAVIGETDGRLCLCDGRLHKLDKPKLKNYRHVRQLPTKDASLPQKIAGHQPVTDAEIRRSIKKVVMEQAMQEGGKTLV